MTEIKKLLPHEVTLLTNRLREHIDDQNQLGQQLGDAMSQGAETFHDNAPADVINREADILFKRAEPIRAILREHEVVDYPAPDSDEITLGSTVLALLDGDEVVFEIAGQRAVTVETNGEVHVITEDSPVAEKIMGMKRGYETSIVIGDRVVKLAIKEVDQNKQREKYTS